MKLVVVGQKWLAAEAARGLVADGHELVAVAVPRLDDRLARIGQEFGAEVVAAERRLHAGAIPPGTDLIVCAHAHCFVDAAARRAARLGAVGYHPSLLPRHRGRDAIEWALRFGDLVTGGTVYQLDDGADTGPILLQDWCWVLPGDTSDLLWRRELGPMGVRILRAAVRTISTEGVSGTAQNEALATWEPAISATPFRSP